MCALHFLRNFSFHSLAARYTWRYVHIIIPSGKSSSYNIMGGVLPIKCVVHFSLGDRLSCVRSMLHMMYVVNCFPNVFRLTLVCAVHCLWCTQCTTLFWTFSWLDRVVHYACRAQYTAFNSLVLLTLEYAGHLWRLLLLSDVLSIASTRAVYYPDVRSTLYIFS